VVTSIPRDVYQNHHLISVVALVVVGRDRVVPAVPAVPVASAVHVPAVRVVHAVRVPVVSVVPVVHVPAVPVVHVPAVLVVHVPAVLVASAVHVRVVPVVRVPVVPVVRVPGDPETVARAGKIPASRRRPGRLAPARTVAAPLPVETRKLAWELLLLVATSVHRAINRNRHSAPLSSQNSFRSLTPC
jgi:hypothetical protein